MTTIWVLVTLAGLLVIGAPIAVALGGAGVVGIVAVYGLSTGSTAVAQSIFQSLSNFVLAAIPLYMLMAHLLVRSGVAHNLFDVAQRIVGRLPGGLMVSSVVSSGIFAAISGSTAATVATIGGVALPEMLERGAPRKPAAGALVFSGTLGILIPPSITFILYGLVSDVSVGALFAAGLLPGVMLVILFSGYIVIRQVIAGRGSAPAPAPTRSADPSPPSSSPRLSTPSDIAAPALADAAPAASAVAVAEPPATGLARIEPASAAELEPGSRPVRERWWNTLLGLLIIPFVIGGIYGGIMTPTEAAGAGAVAAAIVAALRGRLMPSDLWAALRASIQSGAMILSIIAGAGLFATTMSLLQVPQDLATDLAGAGLTKPVFIVVMMVVFLILGCFLDAAAVVLTVMPVLLPVLQALHIDLIWFGVLLVMNMEIGAVTPPLGVNLYVLRSIRPDFSIREILEGAAPFAVLALTGLVLVAVFPAISLSLVNSVNVS